MATLDDAPATDSPATASAVYTTWVCRPASITGQSPASASKPSAFLIDAGCVVESFGHDDQRRGAEHRQNPERTPLRRRNGAEQPQRRKPHG